MFVLSKVITNSMMRATSCKAFHSYKEHVAPLVKVDAIRRTQRSGSPRKHFRKIILKSVLWFQRGRLLNFRKNNTIPLKQELHKEIKQNV